MKRSMLLLVLMFVALSLTANQPSARDVDVHALTLDNGLRVLIVPRPGSPVTAVDMWVDVGVLDETPENNGISHFFEHMLFKGTRTRPQGIDREIEGRGGRTNAATSYDWTHYYIVLPRGQTELAVDVIADIAQNSEFPEEEIAREKDVVLREIDQRGDDPRQFLYFSLYQEFFKVHPYRLPIAGSEESLNLLGRADFLNYMRDHYNPNRMVLVIVGDVDVTATQRLVTEKFGAMQQREMTPREFPQESPLGAKAVKEIARDVAQGYLVYAWPAPPAREARDVYALDVLLAVLSEGRASRFYKKLRKDLNLVTAVDAGYFTQKEPGMFTVYAEFPYAHRALVEQSILTELQQIRDGQLSPQEVERAKTVTLANTAFGAETNAGLAGTLGFYAIVAGDHKFALTYADGIRSVTAADIVRVAKKYIDPDRYLELVLVPEQQAATADPDKMVLQNGLRMVLREDHRSDVVALQAFVGTGLRAEAPEQAGIALLTQRLLLRGSSKRSEEELFTQLENLGARMGTAMLADMAHLYLIATGDTYERAVPLLLEALLDPAFSEEEFARARDELLKEIAAEGDQNFNVIYNNLQSGLYGKQAYGRSNLGTIETVQKITRDDVLRFYEKQYIPSNIVVTAVGDFDRLRLWPLLQRALAGLTPRVSESMAREPITVALPEPKEVVASKRSNLVWMILGFPAPEVAGPDYPAMKLLNAILGGGMSSRLFTELRDKQGLAYSTGSFYPSRQGASHLATYIIAAPPNAEAAKSGILSIIEEIKKNGVPEEELERAKSYVLGNYLIEHESAERRAWYLGWYEMLGVGSAVDATYSEMIEKLTSQDVQRAAQKYLQHYVVSLLGPGN